MKVHVTLDFKQKYIETITYDPHKNELASIQFGGSSPLIGVICDDPVIDLSKLQGYKLYHQDGILHMIFDIDKWNEYQKEIARDKAVQEGTVILETLSKNYALNMATDTEAYTMRYLYPEWNSESYNYSVDDRFMYGDKLYKVLQAHTSQPSWSPSTAVSLYVEIADPANEYPEFKQPTGAHDAYNAGDKMTFEGERYVSTIDGNVWSPAANPSGWTKVTEE